MGLINHDPFITIYGTTVLDSYISLGYNNICLRKNKLNEIEGQLDDAYYSLPEYNSNVDSRGSIDGARSDLYCLREDVEKKLENERF